ncbi:hypothetical protein EBO15_04965 [Actinomadura harenae]|uniref:Triacylglycerol lipase n=1 Tax=Actinomadura harenae TaxID=2483351 RepID=A0A3M2MBY6_9ACTN|nr:hypothetical protein EBO15_04965 [Actinomadura harenae]
MTVVGIGGIVACGSMGRAHGASALDFDEGGYRVESATVKVGRTRKTVKYRLYSGVPYAADPVDPAREKLSVRVPVEVDGMAIDPGRAPIIMNTASGDVEPVAENRIALASGLVVVTSRVRDTAWNGIVDLKAAVRYVHHNKGRLPGDVGRIVASGSGKAGGLAALAGASAGRGQYDDDLRRIGAARSSDRIYAVAANMPVTEIGKADLAYDRNLLLAKYLEPAGARYLKRLPEDDRSLYLKRNSWIDWMHGRISFAYDDLLDLLDQVGNRRAKGLAASAKPAPVLRSAMDFVRQRNPQRARHWWLRTGTDGTDVPLTVIGSLTTGLRSLGDDVDVDWDATVNRGDTVNRDDSADMGTAVASQAVAWIDGTVARRS